MAIRRSTRGARSSSPASAALPCAAFLAFAVTVAALAAPLPAAKTARDRAAWRAILHWPAQCENGWRATAVPGAGIELMPTATSGELVAVECSPGAYQGDAMLYLVDPAKQVTGPLVLRLYGDPGNGRPELVMATTILGVLDFTEKTGTLTVLDKYRGLGDCGIYSTYRLEHEGFVLTGARAKTACDGKPPFSPQRWPKLPA
ncbi:MAG TPA: DUF1176 domain-containing protein [Gaiellaceae bacterium]|nr:DUF1176 domain-containing protein [Gaiellaceae bacterium]